ncbi:MAG: cysteine desulfurase-like protein [bacterium]|nr:cysteine desulfurase-like protein [bacterium]
MERLREQFPSLGREVGGRPAVFFDGPAGSQVPQVVIDAISGYLSSSNANTGGAFATSVESEAVVDEAHRAMADFVGASDPAETAFGPNMTTLTLALARALARTWGPGDEIVVTSLEHDANYTPWVQAARDSGATIVEAGIHSEDCTLNMDDLQAKLGQRTRLVALTAASNAVGSLTPVADVARTAHEAGARLFVDAVHYAPHRLIDVHGWGCDFLACSPYKFFGPHMGVLWGRRELLEELTPYKLRPSADTLPGRWMNGTPSHEGMAGTTACVDYLASIGGEGPDGRRGALRRAFERVADYESGLAVKFLEGLSALPDVRVWGITDLARLDERVPTVALTHARRTPEEIARILGERGIFVWHGNYYALPLTEALGLEPEGMVRIGLLHYNTAAEVDRLLDELRRID